MATNPREEPAREVVELLHGLAAILMSIDWRLETVVKLMGGEDGEEDQP
ncbi:MAG TPA: hypothetical protein VEG24_08730 [Gaiellaceae bacterium]|nr:hypothetical protein [Gaiellaceae bacterium]